MCRYKNLKKKSNSTSRSSHSNSLKHNAAAAVVINKQSYKLIFNDMENIYYIVSNKFNILISSVSD